MAIFEQSWTLPPIELVLPKDEVHLWKVPLNQSSLVITQLGQTLSADEWQRAERFHFDRDRCHFIVARGALRVILGRYLNLEPAQIRFHYETHGKPTLANQLAGETLQFNISHSYELALHAFTCRRHLGVDIEYIRPVEEADRIAATTFATKEWQALRRLAETQKQEGFFNCWTRKEAYIKALGEGLSRPLDQFEVSLAPGDPPTLNVINNPEESARWSLQSLQPANGYTAALVVEGHFERLLQWQWVYSNRCR